VQLQDQFDDWEILRTRDRMRSLISIRQVSTGDILTHLLEGEIIQPRGRVRGSAADDWRDYELRFVGMWARLFQNMHTTEDVSFIDSTDPHSLSPAIGPNGHPLPWRIVDAIYWLMQQAGVPTDEIYLPALPLRFWPDSKITNPDAFRIRPGQRYGQVALYLTQFWLGGILYRDPNAAAFGLWRMLQPPVSTSTNYLARFWVDGPPTTGRIVSGYGAYGTGGFDWMVEHNTYQTYPIAPKATHIKVIGTGNGGSNRFEATLTNTAVETNPATFGFMGHRIPMIIDEPSLKNQDAVDTIAHLVYQRQCVPMNGVQWCGPLALVNDPEDTLQNVNLMRPLRVYDLVQIRSGGVNYPVLLYSVNPDYQVEGIQRAVYEGVFWA
jgi:hypothetical protein